MKKIEYYEVMRREETSTPNDSLDDYYHVEYFEKEEDAINLREQKQKEQWKKIKKDPSWYNLHTDYIVYKRSIELK